MEYIFPFGQTLHSVVQTDLSPKKVFVLGVYASAVHARWIDKDGKQVIAALAVASEPEIFWNGHDVHQQIAKIIIPEEAGKLVPAAQNLNGPSGRALDDLYLKPLGLNRSNTWLCDIIPETRLNPNQRNAIKRSYVQIKNKYNLPKVTIPKFRLSELDSEPRRKQILEELFNSKADTLILLGDLPINRFLNFFSEKIYDNLAAFGDTPDSYGMEHEIKLFGKIFRVIPLCHPRQAQRLGASSKHWYELHSQWVKIKTNK